MIKVGVIGVGVMGRHHARVYSELPGVELVGVADVNGELASAIAKTYHTKAFTNYKELLKQHLDAVTIAVPTSLHKKVSLDVAQAGMNMLVEKPIAETIENANEIINAARRNGLKLMVGHIERFNPIVPVLKESIKNSHVISIGITRVGPFPPRVKDVGIVIDLATHDIDLIRYLTDSEFKRVYSLTSKNLSGQEDSAILCFEMENGVLAYSIVNWLTPFKVREINVATPGKLVKGWFQEQKVIEYMRYKKEDSAYIAKELAVPFAEPLKLELEHFLDCIRRDREPLTSGIDGLKALEIAIKAENGSKDKGG
jgi:predicted dehydrogenase